MLISSDARYWQEQAYKNRWNIRVLGLVERCRVAVEAVSDSWPDVGSEAIQQSTLCKAMFFYELLMLSICSIDKKTTLNAEKDQAMWLLD
jgi:hypothetical protein